MFCLSRCLLRIYELDPSLEKDISSIASLMYYNFLNKQYFNTKFKYFSEIIKRFKDLKSKNEGNYLAIYYLKRQCQEFNRERDGLMLLKDQFIYVTSRYSHFNGVYTLGYYIIELYESIGRMDECLSFFYNLIYKIYDVHPVCPTVASMSSLVYISIAKLIDNKDNDRESNSLIELIRTLFKKYKYKAALDTALLAMKKCYNKIPDEWERYDNSKSMEHIEREIKQTIVDIKSLEQGLVYK